MKKLILCFLVFSFAFSLPVLAQKKHEQTPKPEPEHVVKDTVFVNAAFVNIGGITYNRDLLEKALESSIVIQSDQYWSELYDYITGSKNGNYSVDQVNQLVTPFLSYVLRFKKQQQEQQQQKLKPPTK